MPTRITYIDTAKCIAIWLVLWGHAITGLMPHNLAENPVYVGIYSFHMPLFMLMSGLFAEKSFIPDVGVSRCQSFCSLAWKKFKQLVLPTVLFFGIAWYVIEHGFNWFQGGSGGFNFQVSTFIKHELSCYWFLKSLFLCYTIGWLCWRCGRLKWLAALVVLILSLLIQHWDVSCYKFGYMWPFFLLGIIIRNRLEWLKRYPLHILTLSVPVFFIGYSFYTLEFSFQAKLFKEISIHSCIGYFYYLLMGLSGSLTVLTACMKLPQLNILSRIGTATLGIYLWQKLILELILPHFLQVNMPVVIYNWIFTPVVATVSLFILYALHRHTNI